PGRAAWNGTFIFGTAGVARQPTRDFQFDAGYRTRSNRLVTRRRGSRTLARRTVSRRYTLLERKQFQIRGINLNMPEDELETSEFKEKLEEATERAVEESEHRARWIVYLSFSTALIAVLAAIAALESGTYSNEALLQKNEALLAQTKASDQWAY